MARCVSWSPAVRVLQHTLPRAAVLAGSCARSHSVNTCHAAGAELSNCGDRQATWQHARCFNAASESRQQYVCTVSNEVMHGMSRQCVVRVVRIALPAADVISGNEEALEILKEAFCVSVLDDESVLEHLLQIRHVGLYDATLCLRPRCSPAVPALLLVLPHAYSEMLPSVCSQFPVNTL